MSARIASGDVPRGQVICPHPTLMSMQPLLARCSLCSSGLWYSPRSSGLSYSLRSPGSFGRRSRAQQGQALLLREKWRRRAGRGRLDVPTGRGRGDQAGDQIHHMAGDLAARPWRASGPERGRQLADAEAAEVAPPVLRLSATGHLGPGVLAVSAEEGRAVEVVRIRESEHAFAAEDLEHRDLGN